MASKALYLSLAIAGIAVASATAYWWQHERAGASSLTRPAVGAAGAAGPGGGGARQAVSVEAGVVSVTRMVEEAQAVGSLRSRQTVVLKPEVNGRVTQLNYRDGAQVRKGQVLVQFDNLLELAQLRQSEAQLAIARTNHQRNQELAARNFISASAVDQSSAALQVAQAQYALSQATVARLRVLAPFDGIAGISNVNVGDYLSAGQEIVNLEDMAVMFVDYRLPERDQGRVRTGQLAQLRFDALPGQDFAARVMAIDPRIDAEGRSISVRACIDNSRLLLRPGMFARINAVFDVRENVTVVPEEAVVLSNGVPFVFRISPTGPNGSAVAQRVEVKLGVRRAGQVELTAGGLQAGEQIVLAGQQRLGTGSTPVTISGGTGVRSGVLDGSAAGLTPGEQAAQPVKVAQRDGRTAAPAASSPATAEAAVSPYAAPAAAASACAIPAAAGVPRTVAPRQPAVPRASVLAPVAPVTGAVPIATGV